MPKLKEKPIIVVGAGWAGLACALTLVHHKKKVIVLEAAPQIGGRARGVSFGDTVVDNGQHILIGAYHQTLSILRWLKIPEHTVFERHPFHFSIRNLVNMRDTFQLKLPKVFRSIQLPLGFLTAKGLSAKQQLELHYFWKTMKSQKFSLDKDISVHDLLCNLNQSEALRKKFWEPLSLAALSTPSTIASAKIFLNVLKATFTRSPENSNFLFPKVNLSELLPNAILKYLKQNNASVFCNQRVRELLIDNNECHGIRTTKEELLAQAVVLATPPSAAQKLLPQSETLLGPLTTKLVQFSHQPITTVYLRYSSDVSAIANLTGVVNATSQWVFNRRSCQQNNILSVIITGAGDHRLLSNDLLAEQIATELQQLYPKLPAPIEHRVICEKRAAFSCTVDIHQLRPNNQTDLPHLWLAGDYTQTPYPATLEGAIYSGIQAALGILTKTGKTPKF